MSNDVEFKFKQILNKHDVKHTIHNHHLYLDNGESSEIVLKQILNSDVKRYILSLKRYDKYINISLPGEKVKRFRAYHLTSRKNIESIMADGLLPKPSESHSSMRDTELPYEAIFLVTTRDSLKQLSKYFIIEDPVMLQIDTVGLELFKDSNFREEFGSVVTFDRIDIKRIKVL